MKTEPRELELRTHQEVLEGPGTMSRRAMLRIMGAASVVALGIPGCDRKPKRKIISRIDGPEYQAPGETLLYSSTWTEGPYPYGLVIKTVDGRPVKVDGNPDHPATEGRSSAAMQAALLGLYDPDRVRKPSLGWTDADAKIVDALKSSSSTVIVTSPHIGPSERALLERFLQVAPKAVHLVHDVTEDTPRARAWRKIYGSHGELVPRFDRARIILSLDSDFLGTDGPTVTNIRRFAEGRDPDGDPSRLYVVEGGMSLTGSNADHRIRMKPSRVGELLDALESGGGDDPVLDTLRRDISRNKGKVLIVAGPHLPEGIHARVARMNQGVDAGREVLLWDPAPPSMPVSDAEEMQEAMAAADVTILLGVNPKADGLAIGGKTLVVHSPYPEEDAQIHLPSSHNLESWNDREWGQAGESICQPVIAPLFDTRQEAESLLVWTQGLDPLLGFDDWHAYLKDRWVRAGRNWQDALRSGGHFETKVTVLPGIDGEAVFTPKPVDGMELVIHPHPGIHDGRFANCSWLQELPDPVTKIVWDNVAAMSPATARGLGVLEGDGIRIAVGETSVDLPALVQLGMADQVIQLTLGHGRTHGEVAKEAGGANVAPLLRAEGEVRVTGIDRKWDLVRTQETFDMHGRPIVLDGTLSEYRKDPASVAQPPHKVKKERMYPAFKTDGLAKWGMSIDLNACVGCSACVTACQSENNIPVVGREECGLGRDMHWLRIDRYEEEDGRVHHQPMLCQHCDDAPCETVCPVKATVHNAEGLNEMVYNRCVGTRYCSNNCPYKVRRFNYLRYHQKQMRDPVQELGQNPQVTVRGVGVMEKCTFCVQRIQEVKIRTKNADGSILDGAIQTACQQACPAKAISFGDVNDPKSDVQEKRSSARAFHVLEDLNVNPNVTYLARVRNPGTDGEGEG